MERKCRFCGSPNPDRYDVCFKCHCPFRDEPGVSYRDAAEAFAKRWRGRGSERRETHEFWIDLLISVYGLADAHQRIRFECQTDDGGFIDAYWPDTGLLIEQKSSRVDLDRPDVRQGTGVTPLQQAFRYVYSAPESMGISFVCVCNFTEFRFYDAGQDMRGDQAPVFSCTLEELPECAEDLAVFFRNEQDNSARMVPDWRSRLEEARRRREEAQRHEREEEMRLMAQHERMAERKRTERAETRSRRRMEDLSNKFLYQWDPQHAPNITAQEDAWRFWTGLYEDVLDPQGASHPFHQWKGETPEMAGVSVQVRHPRLLVVQLDPGRVTHAVGGWLIDTVLFSYRHALTQGQCPAVVCVCDFTQLSLYDTGACLHGGKPFVTFPLQQVRDHASLLLQILERGLPAETTRPGVTWGARDLGQSCVSEAWTRDEHRLYGRAIGPCSVPMDASCLTAWYRDATAFITHTAREGSDGGVTPQGVFDRYVDSTRLVNQLLRTIANGNPAPQYLTDALLDAGRVRERLFTLCQEQGINRHAVERVIIDVPDFQPHTVASQSVIDHLCEAAFVQVGAHDGAEGPRAWVVAACPSLGVDMDVEYAKPQGGQTDGFARDIRVQEALLGVMLRAPLVVCADPVSLDRLLLAALRGYVQERAGGHIRLVPTEYYRSVLRTITNNANGAQGDDDIAKMWRTLTRFETDTADHASTCTTVASGGVKPYVSTIDTAGVTLMDEDQQALIDAGYASPDQRDEDAMRQELLGLLGSYITACNRYLQALWQSDTKDREQAVNTVARTLMGLKQGLRLHSWPGAVGVHVVALGSACARAHQALMQSGNRFHHQDMGPLRRLHHAADTTALLRHLHARLPVHDRLPFTLTGAQPVRNGKGMESLRLKVANHLGHDLVDPVVTIEFLDDQSIPVCRQRVALHGTLSDRSALQGIKQRAVHLFNRHEIITAQMRIHADCHGAGRDQPIASARLADASWQYDPDGTRHDYVFTEPPYIIL